MDVDEIIRPLLDLRSRLLGELAQTQDMRQGSISENYRRCGKPECRCADPNQPKHGPYYAYTRKVDGKTKTINLRPGEKLKKYQREVEEYQQFRRKSRELIEINEQICDARTEQADAETDSVKKKSQTSSGKRSAGKSSASSR